MWNIYPQHHQKWVYKPAPNGRSMAAALPGYYLYFAFRSCMLVTYLAEVFQGKCAGNPRKNLVVAEPWFGFPAHTDPLHPPTSIAMEIGE